MKKSKKSSGEPWDRLSELPDSLIFEIFWLLPMKDVVRTTILSKRWENLWTATPYLNFDSHAPKFVNRALLLRRGFKIQKFKFGRDVGLCKTSVFNDIDVWVRLCRENGIENLHLEVLYSENGEVYSVPNRLYLCSTLKVLFLKGCNFLFHGNVQWNQLKRLTIDGFLIRQNLIDKVMSGSPQLEVFIFTLLALDENLSIQSSSLKELWIERQISYDGEEPSAELTIWCPNLEILDLAGVPYTKYLLMNVSSLTHLSLDFYFYDNGDYFVDKTLEQIFPTIQHVEKLTISDCCTQVLAGLKEEYLLSPLLNFKFLSINNSGVEYDDMVTVLQIFPKLETLEIQAQDYFRVSENYGTSFQHFEGNLPESFLLQLRRVDITWNECDELTFPFIEFVLKHASKLQKMVIRVEEKKARSTSWFSQKLQRMPRSSPTAELIFAEY